MLKDLLSNPGIPGFKFNRVTLGDVLSQFLLLAYFLIVFLAFIWFVWGAFQYILARGDKEQLARAKARIIWAIVGLVVFLLAYTLTQLAEQILQPIGGTPIQ